MHKVGESVAMTRMKTFTGTALAALCLIGVSACGSSDEAPAGAATEPTSSAADSRLGTMSALHGRSDVDMFASWVPADGGRPQTAGSKRVSPKGVRVTCTGSGDSLAVSAKFADSEFTARRDTPAATFRLPGLPEITEVPEGNMLWEGNGIGYDQLTVEGQVDLQKLDELQAAPSIYGKFVIACPLA